MGVNISEAIASANQSFTKLEQRVATYLSSRPEAVALETSAEIAEKLQVSPMTVSRFFKKLGFTNLNELRADARRDLYGPTSARIGSRFKSFKQASQTRDATQDQAIANAAIRTALDLRETERWQEAVQYVAHSDSVMVVGFQVMQYLANGFAMRLKYLRSNVVFLDGTDGVYAEVFGDDSETKALILIDTFRYGNHGPILAKAARERGFKVILFCDEFCDWGSSLSDVMLPYPNEGHMFLPFPTGIHFGLNLMYQDVVTELGDKARDKVEQVAKSQDLFGNFLPE